MFKNIFVRDWMTTPAITILPSLTVATTQAVMLEFGVRRLIVTENGHIMGIITIGDVREAGPSKITTFSTRELNYLWSRLTVEQTMTHATLSIGSDALIIDAVAIILEHEVSGLPVIDKNGALVGVISEVDIFRMLINLQINGDIAKE
jgi:acetoin utilization protein AcuB